METIEQILESKPRVIGRNESQKTTLRLVHESFGLKPINIVETGTIRNPTESPDGWATLAWIHWANFTNSRIWTVDISSDHIQTCRNITKNNSKIEYVVSDSVKFLQDFPEKIHLLYLDSYDFDETHECYQHQLNEIKAAMDKLESGAIIVSDDNYKSDWTHGKGNYSIPWMLNNGFELLALEDSQAMLRKI